jgi:formamidopyrimidine-DNA glycosylase
MPELPEVEVTRRRLSPHLLGRRIAQVKTTQPSYFFLTPPAELAGRLVDRRVDDLIRVGKYLVAELDDGSRLLLHLGMTGQLFTGLATSPRLMRKTRAAQVEAKAQALFTSDKHTHLELSFTDGGAHVFFRDTRKFGKVRWLAPGQAEPRLDKLGVDALAALGSDLHAAAKRRSAPVKTVLLDQSVLAGCGNIYADEALFLAGIRPTLKANSLSGPRCSVLIRELQRVLVRSIETGGSSISDYVTPDGTDGAYQDERRVYAREGLPCLNCGTAIKRVVLGQRSTHYCPSCQH